MGDMTGKSFVARITRKFRLLIASLLAPSQASCAMLVAGPAALIFIEMLRAASVAPIRKPKSKMTRSFAQITFPWLACADTNVAVAGIQLVIKTHSAALLP